MASVAALSVAVALPSGCNKQSAKKTRATRTAQASVADFDPDADFAVDLDAYGSQRVDEWALHEAFNHSFVAMDECVAQTKQRHKLQDDAQLDGSVSIAIKLNPKDPKPFAVNTRLSSKRWDNDGALKDCLRDAVAGVRYPTYDGPPQVATFEVDELDPGFEWE
jgi:hypothetical protein